MTVDDTGVFDGDAVLEVDKISYEVRVRLAGHLSPIDGRYHWQGLVYGAPENLAAGPQAEIRIGNHSAAVRLVEKVPSGQLMVSGVGAPPYELVPT